MSLTGTPHFSIAEALRASGGAIPTDCQDNAQQVLEWLEAARVYLGRAIIITSLYRSPGDNAHTAGAASNSQHLRALAADFDVLGLTNHQAMQAILQGVADGIIPAYHELITYTTDHHLHVGVPGESWGSDETNLLEVAIGQYQDLSSDALAQLAQASVTQAAGNFVAQAADVARMNPVLAVAVVGVVLLAATRG